MSSYPPRIQQHNEDNGATVYQLLTAHSNGLPFPQNCMEYKTYATFDNPGDCVRALVKTGNRKRKILLGGSYYNRQGNPI